MKFSILLFATVILMAQSWAKPPNIVLILSDDQSYTDYGFMGHPHIETPHLDKLASESALCSGAVMFLLCCADLLWQLYSPDSIRIRTR